MTWITAGPAPCVPGYHVGARLGVGSSGSVWRATSVLGGPDVALKVVTGGPDAEREVAALRALSHPHVVRLHEAIVLDDGRMALVFDLVDGPTLASVVAQRGHLAPGEVVTLMAPLAQAVADLHADGVQHGDLAPGNVLLDRTGRPVLADLGTARITGEPRAEVFGTPGYVDPVVLVGGPGAPSSDVYGLGALAWFALVGQPPSSPALRGPLDEFVPSAPAALLQVVQAAVEPDPSRRPDPASLAAALRTACEPAPIWLPGAGPGPDGLTHRIRVMAACPPAQRPGRRRHRAPSRLRPVRGRAGALPAPVVLGLLLAAAVALAVVAFAVVAQGGAWPGWSRPPQQPAVVTRAPGAPTDPAAAGGRPPTPAQPPAAVDAGRVVAALAARRVALFADPRAAVGVVAVRGSPAALADEARLRVLRERGLTYRGLQLQTRGVRVVQGGPARLVVEVLTAVSAYDVVDRDGVRVAHVGPEAPRRARLTLVLTQQGWRVHDVQPS